MKYARTQYGSRFVIAPADVPVMRTDGLKWNRVQLNGKFAALWFFLMTKKGGEEAAPAPLPEWPSLCFDYCRNFGFDNGCSNQDGYRTWPPLETRA